MLSCEESVNELPFPMPLLDSATAKSYFISNILTPGDRTLLHNRSLFGNIKRFPYRWNLFQVLKNENNFCVTHVDAQQSVLKIRAVATFEPKHLVQINGGKDRQDNQRLSSDSKTTLEKEHKYPDDESEDIDDREKLRRKRISKANSGKTPWNKGRNHSEETKQRIKERTRIAMQNPKVKKKLVKQGHAQSEETREKIGVALRTMWERRREKLMVQERCYFDWQNLIAEASRRGFRKNEELQWDSYEILHEELEQEWLESIEQRKQTPKSNSHKRAPKSLEQRRKIAAAISAKWADPVYRDRVCSSLSKYHASPARAERQPKRMPRDEIHRQPKNPRPTKKKAKNTSPKPAKIVKKTESQGTRLRRRNVPIYKDPLASAKLEMIKSIRAQREAARTRRSQPLEQAKLLIAEAEKAAKALEAAALWSPLARASLSVARNFIAEAIQSIQSIECQEIDPYKIDQLQTNNGHINGTQSEECFEINIKDFGMNDFNFNELADAESEDSSTNFSLNGLLNNKKGFDIPGINGYTLPRSVLETKIFPEQANHLEMNVHSKYDKVPNGTTSIKLEEEKASLNQHTVSRKWICGRLVEVVEGDEVRVE